MQDTTWLREGYAGAVQRGEHDARCRLSLDCSTCILLHYAPLLYCTKLLYIVRIILLDIAIYFGVLCYIVPYCFTLLYTAPHYTILLHIAPYCSTLFSSCNALVNTVYCAALVFSLPTLLPHACACFPGTGNLNPAFGKKQLCFGCVECILLTASCGQCFFFFPSLACFFSLIIPLYSCYFKRLAHFVRPSRSPLYCTALYGMVLYCAQAIEVLNDFDRTRCGTINCRAVLRRGNGFCFPTYTRLMFICLLYYIDFNLSFTPYYGRFLTRHRLKIRSAGFWGAAWLIASRGDSTWLRSGGALAFFSPHPRYAKVLQLVIS